MAEDDQEKSHEASQKRLDDMRKEGRIPRSQDLFMAASYGGLLLAIMGAGLWSLRQMGQGLGYFLEHADRMTLDVAQAGNVALSGPVLAIALGAMPFFVIPIIMVLLMVAVQRAYIFTPENIFPKLSRISPIGNMKKKFGPSGLFEFGKNTLKMVLITVILGVFLMRRQGDMVTALYVEPNMAIATLFALLRDFLLLTVLLSLIIGGGDYLWQILDHHRKARMSRQELKDEQKESEGDPQSKSTRRQRGQELALNQMLQEVPKADVIIVNPLHYAVALKWDRASGRAPVCVAKGTDEIAARIREAAITAGVPIHRDPPTARLLHAGVKVGEEISRDHYKAVAAAIRFAERMRRQVKFGRKGGMI